MSGFQTRAAFSLNDILYAQEWPSVTYAEGSALLPLLSETVVPEREYEAIVTVDRLPRAPKLVSRRSSGEIAVDARFTGLESLLAAALGFMAPRINGIPMPEEVDTGVYRHLYELDTTIAAKPWRFGDGWVFGDSLVFGQRMMRRGTYTVEKDGVGWQTQNCMVSGFSFSANNSVVSMGFGLVGRTTEFNISAPLTGLLVPKPRLLFNEMVFYLTEEDEFSEADRVDDLVGLSLTFSNNLEIVSDKNSGVFIAEPEKGSPSSPTGGFALPVYSSKGQQIHTWMQDQTALRGLVEFTGEEFETGYNYVFRVWMSDIYILTADIVVQGPSKIQQTFTFALVKPSVVAEDFPTNVRNSSLMIELINNVSTHPLIGD